MKKIRVGVIGVGYLGRFHAEKYSRMENVVLAGVVDINRALAEEVAALFSTDAFTDYRDLCGHVDAVSIVVPTAEHFLVGADCLNHDLDVLIEKPMTTTLEQADELIRIAESRGRVMQIGHLERFNPAVIAVKDIVHHPMFIEAHRLSIFKDRSTDVSVVLDLMIHDIDIIMNLVKSEIKSIHAAGAPVVCEHADIANVIIMNLVKSEIKSIHAAGAPVVCEHADIANVRLEFESGCVANVTASRISTKNQRKIRLFQKDAYVAVDFISRDITVGISPSFVATKA